MAAFGDAVGLVARSEVRSRWRALLGLALLIALVGTVALSAFAGARRTASALDRFVDATQARDARVVVPVGYPVADLDAALEAEEWVTASSPVDRLVFGSGPGTAITVASSPDPGFTSTVDRPLVLEGRLPLPGSTTEIAIDERTVEDEGLGVGDPLEVQTFDPDNFACAIEQTCVLELPDGPPETLVVTGVFRDVDGLLSRDFSPEALAPTSFYDEYGDRTGSIGQEVLVRTANGASDLDRLQDVVDDVGEGALVLPAESDYRAFPEDAVDVVGRGLLVFALVTTVAGGVIVAQAVSRHQVAARERSLRLRDLGLSRKQRALALGLPVAAAGAVGAVVAALAAAPTSAWFPFGGAERVEPDPGFGVDLLTLGLGAVVVAVSTAAWAGWSAWRQAEPRLLRHRPRPSAVAQALARVGADPAVIGGARLAFERREDRGSTMMRSALAATTISIVGMLAAGVVLMSLDDLVATPGRWGWNWDATATPLDPSTADATAVALVGEDGVAGAAVYRLGQIEVNGAFVAAHTLASAEGVDLTLLDGARPSTGDEIALGLLTQQELGVQVGDTVTVTDSSETDHDLEVVGTGVFATFQDRDPGKGAALTPEAWDALATSEGTTELVVRYDEGADIEALESRLGDDYALGFRHATLPVRLDNLDQTRGIGPALMAFFAALGFLGLLHALVTAVRERRAMLAMLRLLGSKRAHVRRSVIWQSLFVTGTSLLIGVPVGLAIGRWTWFQVIEGLGVIDQPQVDLARLALLIPAALGLALIGAVVPAWLAARQRIASALQPA